MIVKRLSAGIGMTAAVVTVAMVAAGCQPVAAAPQYQYGAAGYGTSATVAGRVTSGPTFRAQLGCTTHAPTVVANHGAGTNLGALGTVGAISGRASTAGGSTVTSTGTEDIANLNLLGGLVTGGAIHIVSTTSHTLAFHTAGQMTFANLKIGNIPIRGAIAPNTVKTLPGVGTVTLNEQVRSTAFNAAGLKVTALHIRTNASNVQGGLPLSADLIVGQASSGLTGAVIGRLAGEAYGTNLTVAGLVSSGPSAAATVPCRGSDNRLLTNSTAGLNVPNVVTLGAVADYSRSALYSTSGTAETTSTIGSTNLLSSLLSANAITADAHATITRQGQTVSDAGSRFVGLTVPGFPNINDNVPANTKLAIPNIGTLYLHRIIKTKTSIEIRMVELVLTTAHGSLLAGSDIKIGVASASTL